MPARMITWSNRSSWTNCWRACAPCCAAPSPNASTVLTFADLTLDTSTRQAIRKGRIISLTAKEYDLLELFMRHPRQVLTREMIFDRVWGYDFGGESNVLDVYIRYLRQKLETEGEDAPAPHRPRCGLCAAREPLNVLRLRLTLLYTTLLGGAIAHVWRAGLLAGQPGADHSKLTATWSHAANQLIDLLRVNSAQPV